MQKKVTTQKTDNQTLLGQAVPHAHITHTHIHHIHTLTHAHTRSP